MFSTEDQPADAISAVKALSKANAQGQRIYELTPANMAETLPNLNLARETEDEIRTALNAGLTAIAHTDPVEEPGWRGAGYIIFDPNTGDGAYRISGGQNGAFQAVTIVIGVATTFYGFLESFAATVGPAVPLLKKVVQFLEIARFAQAALETGLKCKAGVEAVIIFISLAALISLFLIEIAIFLANPIVGFAVGTVLDRMIDALIAISGNCRE
jgi:hypothetical protein